MRLAVSGRAGLAVAGAGLLALTAGSGTALADGSSPGSGHALPARPATVPAGAATLAVQSAVGGAYGKAFAHVPGSVSGYVALDGLGVALDRRGSAPQAPASTTKLITTGAALLTMGPTSRFTTSVMRTGSDGYTVTLRAPAPVVPTYFPVPLPTVLPIASASPSSTPSPTDSPSAPATSSASPGESASPSSTPSASPASSGPSAPTPLGSGSSSQTPSPSQPPSATPTPVASTTPTPSASPSVAPTATATPTPSPVVVPVLPLLPVKVYRAADSGGTLHGDLVLVGAGDPSLSSGDLASLARQVRSSGVRRVTGGVYLDAGKFDAVRGAAGWKPGYVGDESGPLSALMVDGNHRSLSRAYRANPDPSNLALFLSDLARAGVKVAGKAQVRRPPHAVTGPVATHSSAPLTTLLRHMDVYSDNTYAEEILKDVGAAAAGHGSSAAGNAVEREIAASFGISLDTLVDGSGLSTRDRLTALQEVAWLQAIDTTPVSAAFRSELPISCRSGTLAGRLCGAYLSGRIQAKTGTLDHTANLAGFTTTRSGRRVWFSFMADRSSIGYARGAIDRMVASLARSSF